MTETANTNEDTITNGDSTITETDFGFDKMSSKELLKIAFTEPTLQTDIGMCGTACSGDCKTCILYGELASQHFVQENLCATCSSECVTYTTEFENQTETQWICEHCYSDTGDEDHETGLDWNESGYFD